ncbi:nucleoside hydrolase [Palleronia sp.]|uniref:nucleoside hydrolase n=1 Tax=Palleronia sp. TaxID=1940284 RepID=UPI0035C7D487
MKMIIDTDPGVDDALAILYAAAHPEIELAGLTSVFGNVTIEQATRNALYLVERARLDIPVAQGAGRPLSLPPFPASHGVHGPEGFGDLPAVRPQGAAISETAAEFLVRMAREQRGELIICPIGPITNIAQAIELDPAFAGNIRGIVFMGGALDVSGNITPAAEANTYHDPHALDIVLKSGAPTLMIGLDVTMQVLLTVEDFETLARIDRAHGPFLQEMSHFYLEFYRSKGLHGCGLHDPLAVMACIMPEILKIEAVPMEVVLDGDTIGKTQRSREGRTTQVAIDCDPEQVKAQFFQAFTDSAAP